MSLQDKVAENRTRPDASRVFLFVWDWVWTTEACCYQAIIRC